MYQNKKIMKENELKEAPTIGWITGERLSSKIKYGWKCTSCKEMNYIFKFKYWSTSDEKCANCEAEHIVDIDSDNIKY